MALETATGQLIYGMAYGRMARPEMTVSVRTVYLRISQERPVGERNVWPVQIEKTVFQGDFSQVHLCWGDQRLVARCAAWSRLRLAGMSIWQSSRGASCCWVQKTLRENVRLTPKKQTLFGLTELQGQRRSFSDR
jgi:hypothetical protein